MKLLPLLLLLSLSSCTIVYHSADYYVKEPTDEQIRAIIIKDSKTNNSQGSITNPDKKAISKK